MRPIALARRFLGRWGLIAALAALPIFYLVHDLTTGYQLGIVHGHAVIHHDLTRIGLNVVQGLSNGSIWALIAIGYTLVYGIIELINFAHGDVFMIGSFTAVGLYSAFGLTTSTGTVPLILGLLAVLVVSMIVCGTLNALIERVGYKRVRGRPKPAPL